MTHSNYLTPASGLAQSLSRWICLLVLGFFLTACVQEESPLTGATNNNAPPPATDPPPVDDNTPPMDDDPPPADDNTPPPMGENPPPNDQQIFEATLYPHLVDPQNRCVDCHGVTQEPTFSVSDSTIAYNAITSQQKVNLNDPAASRVYLRPAVDRHNCGGDAICDRIAGDFLAAIQDWANQVAATAPPPTVGSAVISDVTNFAAGIEGSAARADGNVVAMFTFSEGAGDITMDTSGVGTPITLQLEGTEWVDGGGLKNVSGKAQASVTDSQKLFAAISPENAYTVEAWIIPDNDAQDGPARIVSYSENTQTRNMTMGQNAIYYQLRNRSTNTNANGQPALEADIIPVVLSLTHVVMTFDGDTGRKVYVNGQLGAEENVADTLEWTDDQILVLGNEVTNDRLWQGIFRMVAIHNKALTDVEVQQNFDAGAGNLITLRFDVANIVGGPAYIDMQASQLDASAYLFAKPTLYSDVTGVAVKNIRIAVNGFKPVAAQPFRRIDTTMLQSPLELSSLGAVIPVGQGQDNDNFTLEFEVLGNQVGFAEQDPAASPPVPVPDVPEPDNGMRTFSQINDTMSVLTGIDKGNNNVRSSYAELRGALPPTADLLSFGSAQQVAIQRLAKTYCGEIVNNNATCSDFFGACEIDGNAKDQVATTLHDRFIGDLANQPDRIDVTTEIVSVIDDFRLRKRVRRCRSRDGSSGHVYIGIVQRRCDGQLIFY